MFDMLSLGSAPCEEECVQVTRDGDYLPAMRAECRRYVEKLEAYMGPPPDGARFRIKANSHDFGTYLDVEIVFDEDDEEAAAYAYRCESDGPATWDAVPAAAAA